MIASFVTAEQEQIAHTTRLKIPTWLNSRSDQIELIQAEFKSNVNMSVNDSAFISCSSTLHFYHESFLIVSMHRKSNKSYFGTLSDAYWIIVRFLGPYIKNRLDSC